MTIETNPDKERLVAFCLQVLADEQRLPTLSECEPFLNKLPNSALEPLSEYQHLKPLSEKVLASIFTKAVTGSISHQKLWFQIVEHWAAPKPVTPIETNKEETERISINLKPFTGQLANNGN